MDRRDRYIFSWDGLASPLARMVLGCRSGRPGYHEVFEDGAVFRASAQDRLSGRDVLWVHGASIGEVKCLQPIVEAFLEESLCVRALITYTSPDGLREIRRGLSNRLERIVTCPFLVTGEGLLRTVLTSARLRLCVIAEQDVWPSMIRIARWKAAPLLIVDGRFKSVGRGLAGWIRGRTYALIRDSGATVCVATRTEYEKARRFIPEDRLRRTGPGKAIEAIQRSAHATRLRSDYTRRLRMADRGPLIVAGNLASDEAVLVADLAVELARAYPRIGIVIAPRHTRKPNVMDAFRSRLDERGLQYVTLSSLVDPGGEGVSAVPVVLVDRTGYLADLYAVADVAIVGGSFYGGGGHNFLEPVAMMAPVVCGPGAENWEGLSEVFLRAGAIVRTTPSGLGRCVADLLSDRPRAMEQSERAFRLLEDLATSALENVRIAKDLAQGLNTSPPSRAG